MAVELGDHTVDENLNDSAELVGGPWRHGARHRPGSRGAPISPDQPKHGRARVALAVAGALVAGALGSWRATRLRPASALARVG
jgi:hypothetical protein